MIEKVTEAEYIWFITRDGDKVIEPINTDIEVSEIVDFLNNELPKLKEKLERYEHELSSLDGLYVSDNKECKEPFQLSFSEILED